MWQTVSKSSVSKFSRYVRDTPYSFGTQWTMPIETALSLSPPPEVIYFMSDGNAKENAAALGRMARSKGTVIHTFAMQTTNGSNMFQDLAETTGGEFRIILSDGSSVLWEEYSQNPGKFQL